MLILSKIWKLKKKSLSCHHLTHGSSDIIWVIAMEVKLVNVGFVCCSTFSFLCNVNCFVDHGILYLFFLFWPMCCLSFFRLRILITNSSCKYCSWNRLFNWLYTCVKTFRYYSDLLNIVSGNSKLVLYASRKTCEKEQGTYRCTIFVKKRGKQIRYRSVKEDWTTTKCEYNECYLIIIKIKVLLQAYVILANYGYPVLALWYYYSRPN